MSETTKNVLFIGGPADGNRMIVPRYTYYWKVMTKPKLEPSSFIQELPTIEEMLTINTVTYRATALAGSSRAFEVFIPETQTADQTIELLLSNYKP